MKRVLVTTISGLLALAVQAVPAADVRVRVFDREAGKPMHGVSVCLGTQARIDQFGAQQTDASGNVAFASLPRTELLVTVSKEGYKSEQEKLIISGSSRQLVLSLAAGGGGTVCNSASNVSSASGGGLQVTSFALASTGAAANDRRVTLNFQASGKVTQYRASERADLNGVDWQDVVSAPLFELSAGAGNKRVYFQVRRHSSLSDAVVETVSPVVSATISVN